MSQVEFTGKLDINTLRSVLNNYPPFSLDKETKLTSIFLTMNGKKFEEVVPKFNWDIEIGDYYLKDDDFRTTAYSKDGNTDKASIWSLNAGYKFNDKAQLWGSYAKNSKADIESKSWQMLFKYGNLYGGGHGPDGNEDADVYGPITVTVKGGTATTAFGCNNNSGTPKSTVTVNIEGGTVTNVCGGGNAR